MQKNGAVDLYIDKYKTEMGIRAGLLSALCAIVMPLR